MKQSIVFESYHFVHCFGWLRNKENESARKKQRIFIYIRLSALHWLIKQSEAICIAKTFRRCDAVWQEEVTRLLVEFKPNKATGLNE